MNGFLSTPWPWWAALIALAAGVVWLASWYQDQPASPMDEYLAGIDDAIRTGTCTFVTFDPVAESICDAVMEDAEVDWLERLYFEIPAAVK